MLSIRKLLPVGLAAALLAGCSGGTIDPQPGATSPSAVASTDPPRGGGVDSPPTGGGVDSPPSGGSSGAALPPAVSAGVPGACTLVTQADLIAVTSGTVTLLFVHDPSEDSRTDGLTGATSSCRQPLRSSWSDAHGKATVDGVVIVQVQSSGADIYFPVRTGDRPVAGVGDEAMTRNDTLYVRLGTGVLIVEIGIANPAADASAVRLGWAKTLAVTAIGRI